jgi:hypothetical protein
LVFQTVRRTGQYSEPLKMSQRIFRHPENANRDILTDRSAGRVNRQDAKDAKKNKDR